MASGVAAPLSLCSMGASRHPDPGIAASFRVENVVKGLLRFLAGVFLLVAVIAAVNDATRSIAAGTRVPFVSTLDHWSRLAPVTLAGARTFVQRRAHPLVWYRGSSRSSGCPPGACSASSGCCSPMRAAAAGR